MNRHRLLYPFAPAALAPEVEVASDALIVLMAYQNDGYALLHF